MIYTKRFFLPIFRFFSSPEHVRLAKEALIKEVGIMEEKRKGEAATTSEGSVAAPPSKAPRPSTSSFVNLYDEILEQSAVESRPVRVSSAVIQVESYLAEQTIPRSDNPLL